MTKEEIYEELGISGASAAQKKRIIDDIFIFVNAQFAGLVGDLLDDDQTRELEQVAADNGDGSPEVVLDWVQRAAPESLELYSSILRDHLDQIKDQLGTTVA